MRTTSIPSVQGAVGGADDPDGALAGVGGGGVGRIGAAVQDVLPQVVGDGVGEVLAGLDLVAVEPDAGEVGAGVPATIATFGPVDRAAMVRASR